MQVVVAVDLMELVGREDLEAAGQGHLVAQEVGQQGHLIPAVAVAAQDLLQHLLLAVPA
jgi:hypothetical protein